MNRRHILINALKLFDLVLVVVSLLLAAFSIPQESGALSFTEFLSIRIKVANFILFFVLLGLWHMVFSLFGLYDSRRLSTRRVDVIELMMFCKAFRIEAAEFIRGLQRKMRSR